jgi:hypothetical protein
MADDRRGNRNKERTPKQIVGDVIEQRKASQRYQKDNYYPQWAELYRNIHARVRPDYIRTTDGSYKVDADGNKIESDRTNVCVPDHFVMFRRGSARLTRNPPNLRVRGGPDSPEGQQMRDKTSARLMFQWDRSESQRAFKRIVHSAKAFGTGFGKVWYDEVPVIRKLRKLTKNLSKADFQGMANSTDQRISKVVQKYGDRLQDPTPLDQQEMATMVAELGDESTLNQASVRYKGPLLGHLFLGDVYMEAGFHSLNESGYVIENGMRDEEWLTYWLNQTTIDPRTGQTQKVIDPKAADKTLSKAGTRTFLDEQEMTLRRFMRDEIEIADPMTSGKPVRAPKKRFMVDERHTFVDGFLAIDFIGEESDYLGRLWYPWDTYGRYTYVEMIPIPDLLGGYGMSPLTVSRFLLMLKNIGFDQRVDFVTNILLPLLKVRKTSDLTSYDVARTAFARLLQLDNLNDVGDFVRDPTLPQGAWNSAAELTQMMQQVDPSTTDFAPGTAEAPNAGKFATTAELQQKASDSVTADELDEIGMCVRDIVELMLWMDQQASTETEHVPAEYFQRAGVQPDQMEEMMKNAKPQRTDAVSLRSGGMQAKIIDVSHMDIQEAYEILPEQGSTLAADDQFKVGSLQQFIMLGERHPDVVNLRACISELAEATPGISPENVILPPPPPQPPTPPIKVNFSITAKWEELPADVKAALLQTEGLPTEMTHMLGIGHAIGKMSEAADAAHNLEQPAHEQPPPQVAKPNGKGKPGATPPK